MANSSTNSQETEVKLHTPELEGMHDRLLAAGAVLTTARTLERNMRYENAERTLVKQGVVLRLRQDNTFRLTYKAPGKVASGIMTRDELEVEISDYDTMDAILQRLGFRPHMAYEKYRTTYHLYGAEIVLDEMPFGNFMEIEGDNETIERIIAELGLEKHRRVPHSYSDLFDFVRRHMGLAMADLTFDAFDGLTVPEEALFPSGEM